MARKNGKKLQPAVQTIWFEVTTPAENFTTNFIDLSQAASLVNRRFYRQGINWAVDRIETFNIVPGSSPSGQISLSKLPSTWVMSNAWEKSFRAWQAMNKQALEENESVKPKFLDFKIYADADHHSAGFDANLLPTNGLATYNPGEWVASKIVVPTAGAGVVSRELIATGASYPGAGYSGLDAVSLIEGYAASRALPQPIDPSVPQDNADASGPTPENWMAALFNQGIAQDEEVLIDMGSENNQAPYPYEDDGVNIDTMYPSGANQGPGLELVDYGFLTSTTIGNETHLTGGMFPCGLMRIDITNDNATTAMNTIIGVRLVPGDHRGYMCEPMTDM
jgi:hypothetical protein